MTCVACHWQSDEAGLVGALLQHRDATGHADFRTAHGDRVNVAWLDGDRVVEVSSAR